MAKQAAEQLYIDKLNYHLTAKQQDMNRNRSRPFTVWTLSCQFRQATLQSAGWTIIDACNHDKVAISGNHMLIRCKNVIIVHFY